ncbi:iron ABC transporter permease [Labilibaculum sp. K2S]|uniref:FecCD family ABC transporter permease n=1 Tax=Labilibaculum sp. K2S TaxID=3056386 RepID=UPI0025A4730A|nr:iron ABC transporter permease [Labilibaculum sp. K2S]MDM8158577.1 iron ABC transporter permease [Labilibaculum sp. K2S]
MQIKSHIPFFLLLVLVSLTIGICSLMLGRFSITANDFGLLFRSLFNSNIKIPPQITTVLFDIRLPRILVAFLVGGTLSITGATYQGMFRNPMVSPSILGVSAGAGFGASLAILLGLSSFLLQGFSFIFGIMAVAAVYAISHSTGKKFDKCLTLILSGMIVSAVFAALISILKYVADPNNALPSIVYWLMGSLSEIEMKDLGFIAAVSLPGLLLLSLSGWKLDMLSFGDDEARTMGVQVNRIRIMVIAIATLMTAVAISISGIIGWVGLIIPHIARMLIGPKNSVLLPASFFIGGIFLLIVDGFSRTVSSMEIPLGITTSLIGAPFFIYILMKTSKKNQV